MGSASIKLVTLKFNFLLAITTTRKVADQTKPATGQHCRFQQGRVTSLPTSLAKADSVVCTHHSTHQTPGQSADGLVTVIKMAYDTHPPQVRAHSRCALVPNWSHIRGANKKPILQAIDWHRENTFIQFYAGDLHDHSRNFGSAVLSF